MIHISYDRINKLGACAQALKALENAFGRKRVPLTVENFEIYSKELKKLNPIAEPYLDLRWFILVGLPAPKFVEVPTDLLKKTILSKESLGKTIVGYRLNTNLMPETAKKILKKLKISKAQLSPSYRKQIYKK